MLTYKTDRIAVDMIKDFKITPDNVVDLQKIIAVKEWEYEKSRGNLLNPNLLIGTSPTKSIDQLKFGQKLTFYENRNMKELIGDVYAEAVNKSPVGTSGKYKSSHKIWDVTRGNPDRVYDSPSDIPENATEVFIFSDAPQARKIEIGLPQRDKEGNIKLTIRKRRRMRELVSKRKYFSEQAPRGVYKQIEKDFRRSYPDYRYKISHTMVDVYNTGSRGRWPGVYVTLRGGRS